MHNELVKRRDKEDAWITPEEAIIQIAKKRTFADMPSMNHIIKLGCLKANILRGRHYSFSESITDDIKKEAFWKIGDNYNFLLRIHLISVLENGEWEPRKQSKLVAYYLHIAMDVIMLDFCRISQVVVFDESILHNNCGIDKLGSYMCQIDLKSLACSGLAPLGIVYCTSDSETIFKQVKQRCNEGTRSLLQQNLDDAQLYAGVEEGVRFSAEVVENLKRRDVPVLEINTFADVATNVTTINNFIKQVSV
ncbi:hypothetical protein ACFL3Q_08185 [Planctomycetota bacterium]